MYFFPVREILVSRKFLNLQYLNHWERKLRGKNYEWMLWKFCQLEHASKGFSRLHVPWNGVTLPVGVTLPACTKKRFGRVLCILNVTCWCYLLILMLLVDTKEQVTLSIHKTLPNFFFVYVGKVTPTGKVTPFHGTCIPVWRPRHIRDMN